MKIKSLFEEAQDIVAQQPQVPAPAEQPNKELGGFKSPYTISNQEALSKELANINKNTELLSDKIVET